MSPVAILILALSMSADAFAAALARGAKARPTWPDAIRAGLLFGAVEALAPLLGWALGRAAAGYVEAIDHWIAFALLLAVGGRMIRESRLPAEEPPPRGGLMLLATAVGTSVDAAAVGIGLALIDVNIAIVAAAVGIATFTLATLGLRLGRLAGERLGRRVEALAGAALITLGGGILAQHMGWIG